MIELKLSYAIYFTISLTFLIALIRLLVEDDVKFRHLFNLRVLLYLLILLVGNVATTLLAVKIIEKYFSDSGPSWFWISFIGVFGFEAIIKNINITIFKTGVLTINDWIERAQESALKAVRQAGQNHDGDAEIIVARPGHDFRYKIINMDIVLDIEKPDAAKITEDQELKCCVDRLNDISTKIDADGAVLKFKDSSGNVSDLEKGKFRTVFEPKKKGDVFVRRLTYDLEKSFMNPDKESWFIKFETPTKKYKLTLILPADKILLDFKFYRIIHLMHEIDHKSDVAEGRDLKGRPRLVVSIDNLQKKENFLLSWRWQNAVSENRKLGGN